MTGAIVGILNDLALELGAEDEREEAKRRRKLTQRERPRYRPARA